jgi:hypothetical protein
MNINLLTDQWVPVLSGNNRISRLTIADAMEKPSFSIQSFRPDFDFAVRMLLVGLAQTGFRPNDVFGKGQRFLQDEKAKSGKQKPIGNLLLDEPSAIAIKQGRDHFVKGNRRNKLCPYCATIALYVHTQFCGPYGPGYYPGNLFHSALYLIDKEVLRDTVAANVIDKSIPESAYFSVPNLYWLGDPENVDDCAICGNTGPVITAFWIKAAGEKFDPSPNPLCSRTTNGKRYSIGLAQSELDIVEGAVVDSQSVIAPLVVSENAKPGDNLIGFGTHYDKGSLTRTFESHFLFRQKGFNHIIIRQALRSIWKIKFSSGVNIDRQSTFAAQVIGNISDEVVQSGKSELDACLAVYELYCPNPGRRQLRKYPDWEYYRSMIQRSAVEHDEGDSDDV